MTLDELLPLVSRLLLSRGHPHFVFGGVAVSAWGRQRTTNDLDLVVQLDRPAIPQFLSDLKKLGFRITSTDERKFRKGRLIRLPLGGTALDVKVCGQDDLTALARSKRFAAGETEYRVASAEDLVLYKLQSWRRQDQADIENLLSHVRDLDRRYISRRLPVVEKSSGLPLIKRWREVLPSAPP